jgi:hypothetical protein
MDSEQIVSNYTTRALHVQLQGLNGLKASGLLSAAAAAAAAVSGGSPGNGSSGGSSPAGSWGGKAPKGTANQKNSLRLFIRFGRFWVEKPLLEHLT